MNKELLSIFQKKQEACEAILAEINQSEEKALALVHLYSAVQPKFAVSRSYDTKVFESDLEWLERLGQIRITGSSVEVLESDGSNARTGLSI